MQSIDELFKGRHFEREIIILCVRWYLRFKLSFRDLVEMMAERGIDLAHTTIMRWIQRYVPELKSVGTGSPAEAGGSWRVDETYVKIKGRWSYLYRAVDKQWKDCRFPAPRQAGCRFREGVLPASVREPARPPRAITLDGYQASHRAAREILANIDAAIGLKYDRRST